MICFFFRKNIILQDCVEERNIHSQDYNPDAEPVTAIATRQLQLAMVPGKHLVKVQIDRATYQAKVESL
jgi:hypothetical protein